MQPSNVLLFQGILFTFKSTCITSERFQTIICRQRKHSKENFFTQHKAKANTVYTFFFRYSLIPPKWNYRLQTALSGHLISKQSSPVCNLFSIKISLFCKGLIGLLVLTYWHVLTNRNTYHIIDYFFNVEKKEDENQIVWLKHKTVFFIPLQMEKNHKRFVF